MHPRRSPVDLDHDDVTLTAALIRLLAAVITIRRPRRR
jgi:hypothetical protein